MKLDMKEFLIDSHKTAILAGVDTFGNLCVFPGPECFKANGTFQYVHGNASNTELSPSMIGPSAIKIFMGIAPSCTIPKDGISNKPIGLDTLFGANLPWDVLGSHTVMFFMPMIIRLKGGKEWIKGPGDDHGVQDEFKGEYGEIAAAWLKTAMNAYDNEQVIATL